MQQEQALGIARMLVKAGVPVFVAHPDSSSSSGWSLPFGWESTEPDTAAVEAWRPGMALCAVTGRTFDLVDVDTYAGGDERAIPMPKAYLLAETASGGRHYFVKTLGVGSLDGKVAPGIDIKSGTAEGTGRGFAFIAPTVRRSKVDGVPREYRWVVGAEGPVLPTPDQLAADGSGALLAARVLEIRRTAVSATPRTVPQSVARREWESAVQGLRSNIAHWQRYGWGGEAHSSILASTTHLARLSTERAEEAFFWAFRDAGAEPDGNDLSKLHSALEKAVPDVVVPDAELSSAEAFFLGGEAPPQPFGMGPSLPADAGGAVFAGSASDPLTGMPAGDMFAPVTRERFRNRKPPPPAAYGAFGGAVPLFYAEGVHWLQGESESGKTWVALAVVADVLRHGERALLVDYEDTEDRVLERLDALGVTDDEIERLVYVDGHTASFSDIVGHVAVTQYACMVIDGVTSALTSAQLKGRDEQEMTLWCDHLPRRATMAICIDHVVKSKDDRGGMAIGSQAKKSVVTGSSFEVVCITKFGRGSNGEIRLNLQKDKPGALRGAGVKSIKLHFVSNPGTQAVTLSRAGAAGASAAAFFDATAETEHAVRVKEVMGIIEAYYAAGGKATSSVHALVPVLRRELGVSAKNDVMREAIRRRNQGLGMPVQSVMDTDAESP